MNKKIKIISVSHKDITELKFQITLEGYSSKVIRIQSQGLDDGSTFGHFEGQLTRFATKVANAIEGIIAQGFYDGGDLNELAEKLCQCDHELR